MSVVNELIKELRGIANCYYGEICSYAGKIEEAADTIESLSAKLQTANMGRSVEDCGGGWIYCGDGENLPEEDGVYWVTLVSNSANTLAELIWREKNAERFVRRIEFRNGSWRMSGIKVLAWMPCNEPEPYQ